MVLVDGGSLYVGKPCPDCGEPKPAPNRRYCDDCRDLRYEAVQNRKKARERAQRLPCLGCGGLKETGRAIQYCKACRDKRENAPRICERCSNPSRGPRAKLCVDCKAKAREAEREYMRKWSKENPRPSGTWYNATHRMHKRLQRERKGVTLKLAEPERDRSNGTRVDSESFPPLPSAQMVAWIDRQIRAGRVTNRLEMTKNGSPVEILVPLDIPRRTLARWRNESDYLVFNLADQVLTNMGACWFEVWDGPELARNGWTVERVFTTTEMVAA